MVQSPGLVNADSYIERNIKRRETMSNSYISKEERIERLNAVRHEIAQHFNEGFAWIDQILCEEIEQISMEEKSANQANGKWVYEYDSEYWGQWCKCSECGGTNIPKNYCADCGAKMQEYKINDGTRKD